MKTKLIIPIHQVKVNNIDSLYAFIADHISETSTEGITLNIDSVDKESPYKITLPLMDGKLSVKDGDYLMRVSDKILKISPEEFLKLNSLDSNDQAWSTND